MKNIFLPLLFLLILASSCSKDAQYNRRMEGNWKVESSNGQPVPNQYYSERTITFKKTDRKAGKVTMHTVPLSGSEYSLNGTYTLSQKGYLHMELTDANGVPVTLEYHIESIEDDKITWTVVENEQTEVLVQ